MILLALLALLLSQHGRVQLLFICLHTSEHLGSTFDRGAHVCNAELGDGIQALVSGTQNSYVFWESQRTQGEKNGLDQSQRISCLHHVL